jgi:hypothetical protein
MGGDKKGGGESTTQTQSTEPPAYLQPFLQYGGTAGHQLLSQLGPRQYFGGNTVTPFSPQTNQALNMQQQRAIGGSPLTGAAQNLATDTLSGNYLNSNPYLDQTFDRAAGAVNRSLDQTYARSGRDLDSNMAVRADQLNNLATNIYGGNYQAERDRQLNTMGSAIPLAREDYFDISQLGQVGSAVEGQSQNIIQDRLNRFNFEQDAPFTALDRYIAQLAGTPQGQTTTSSQPIHRNPIGSAMGGAATGASVGGPWGALIGGGVGLLSAYM